MSHEQSPPPRTASGTFSDRSLSQDSMDLMEESDEPYRSSDSSRRNTRTYSRRNYESDYDDQRFSSARSSSSSRYRPEYRSGRERQTHHTAPALESRRRMFERDQQREGRWDHEYSDSYSDVEFKRHHYPNDMSRDRARERERERVTEFKRFFQQKGLEKEDLRPNKSSMRRQDSSTSQDSSFNRHYPEGLFEMYRSRFEVFFSRH